METNDDGTPLGSTYSTEDKIDSIAQSWAVLSGTVPPPFAERAMDAVRAHLVNRGSRMLLLLAPPFDCAEEDPGYIKAYLPGSETATRRSRCSTPVTRSLGLQPAAALSLRRR